MYEHIQTKFDTLPEFVEYYHKYLVASGGCPKDWTWAMVEHFNRHREIKGFKYLSEGSYRMCFLREGRKWVIKIPKNLKGIQDCRNEASIYKHRKGKLNPKAPSELQGALARCRLREIKGIPCLIMPYLENMRDNYNEHPEWTKQLMDGVQVGKTKKGKVVVYDYGNESDGNWTPESDDFFLKYTNDRLEWNVLLPKRKQEEEKKKLDAVKGVASVPAT